MNPLLRTKGGEDPGFEIIKEVQGAGQKSFSGYNNPLNVLSALSGSTAGRGLLGGSGTNPMLSKCKCFLD